LEPTTVLLVLTGSIDVNVCEQAKLVFHDLGCTTGGWCENPGSLNVPLTIGAGTHVFDCLPPFLRNWIFRLVCPVIVVAIARVV
jgi:hypothetical protein